MAANLAKLQTVLAAPVQACGFELWGCEYVTAGKYSVLKVYIDSDKGVTIDDCAQVSKQINAVLEVENEITGSYRLEVSSPGLDRPLFCRQHYEKYIGAEIKLTLHIPLAKRRHVKGRLTIVEDDGIVVIDEAGEACQFKLANIKKASLVA